MSYAADYSVGVPIPAECMVSECLSVLVSVITRLVAVRVDVHVSGPACSRFEVGAVVMGIVSLDHP
jgi:hypothetical protein